MAIVQKLLICVTGLTTILAKSHYPDYEPYKNFHVPWTLQFPQPLIGIDGSWQIAPVYPYKPPGENYYSHPNINYEHELLVQSLNTAIIRLNQLLAPSSSNIPETIELSPYTNPEVLIEALNEAIDRLRMLLSKHPIPLNPHEGSASTILSIIHNQDITTTSEAQDVVTSTSTEASRPTTLAPEKVSYATSTGASNLPTISSENVSNSVSNAIKDLDKLFATLPDELKNPNVVFTTKKPPENSVTNKPSDTDKPSDKPFESPITSKPLQSSSKPFESPITSKPLESSSEPFESPITSKPLAMKPFLSAEHIPNSINPLIINEQQPTTSETQPFTSNVLQEKTSLGPDDQNDISKLVVTNENNIETSTISSPLSMENTESLSVVPSQNADNSTAAESDNTFSVINLLETILGTTIQNIRTSTENIATTTNDVKTTTNIVKSEFPPRNGGQVTPVIDIRFGEKKGTDFIFPDTFEAMYNKRKPLIQEEIDMASRFQDKNENSKPVDGLNVLDYKPSRPPIHADIFPPIPTAKPPTDSNFQATVVTPFEDDTSGPSNNPDIWQKPSSPPLQHFPNPTQSTNNKPDLQSPVTALPSIESGDSNKITSKPIDPQTVLEYKPSRPPFHAEPYPPISSSKPNADKPNLQFPVSTSLPSIESGDSNKITSKPIDPQTVLEYKPSRPPFHAEPYPSFPSSKPQPNDETIIDVTDRFQVTTTKPEKTGTTMESVHTTTSKGEYSPTHYYSSPINLEYKPTRPFYAPNPIVYPMPAIPPGSP